ncbi:MAG: GDP-L-fucose synthase [Spirochaetales bacterium]|nr:GDP-L-fucose synthase [Spirochaetales bacterium]
MNRNSKIYLAGHRGLVGSAFLRRLEAGGYAGIITRTHRELDLTRQEQVEAFFERERPEVVFLAAAKVGGIYANNTRKAEFIYQNMMMAANVIHASYRYGVKKLLNLGSSCIYPRDAAQPLKEEYLLTGPLESTNDAYALAKIAAVKLCRFYNEQYGTNFLSVMPTNMYGPDDNFDFENSHVLPALMRRIYLGKLLMDSGFGAIRKNLQLYGAYGESGKFAAADAAGEAEIRVELEKHGIYRDRVVIWGTGTPYREFLYSDDLADACVFLMEKYDARDIGEIINIGTGTDISIKDLACLIQRLTGYKGMLDFDPSKPDGTPRKLLDVSRLRGLGWKEKVGLEEGIGRVIGLLFQ